MPLLRQIVSTTPDLAAVKIEVQTGTGQPLFDWSMTPDGADGLAAMLIEQARRTRDALERRGR